MFKLGYFYYLLFAFAIIFTTDITDSSLGYFVSFSVLFLFCLTLFLGKNISTFTSILDFIPLVIFIVWMYGFLLGVLLDNNLEYIIRNFAGMVLFLLYYIISNQNIGYKKIVLMLLYVSVITTAYGFYIGLSGLLGSSKITPMESGAIRLFYLANMSTYFISLVWGLFYFFSPMKIIMNTDKLFYLSKIKSLILFILSTIVIFMSASKGYILGYILILFSYFFIVFRKYFFSFIVSRKYLILVSIVFVLIFVVFSSGYFHFILNMFSNKDAGNSVRFMQLKVMFKDLTFLGKGLGSLVAGYDSVNTYGFEIIYLNIIHKFGMMAFFIYIVYFYILYKIIQLSFSIDMIFISLVFLANMGYLLPSLGNPILFAPIHVMLTVMTLSMLKQIEEKKKLRGVTNVQ